MWIDGDDRAQAVALSNRGQTDSGFSLVAANLEDDALRGGARRHEGEKAGLTLGQKPRSRPDASPGFIDRRREVSRQTADGRWLSQQYCSNAAVKSVAMSRALRPSMLRRSSMNTRRASLNSAICGDDGA